LGTRTAIVTTACTVLLLLTAQTCPRPSSSPETATYWRMREVRRAIAGYQARTGTIPQSLTQLCPEGGPCPATPPGEPLVDAWGRPFRYERLTSGDYVLASAGADGTFGTTDDITFSTIEEAKFVARVIGCYAADFSWWVGYPSNELQLTDSSVSEGVFRVLPMVPGHLDGVWRVEGDTAVAIWAAGDRASILRLVPRDSELTGYAEVIGHKARSVRATRIPCND